METKPINIRYCSDAFPDNMFVTWNLPFSFQKNIKLKVCIVILHVYIWLYTCVNWIPMHQKLWSSKVYVITWQSGWIYWLCHKHACAICWHPVTFHSFTMDTDFGKKVADENSSQLSLPLESDLDFLSRFMSEVINEFEVWDTGRLCMDLKRLSYWVYAMG